MSIAPLQENEPPKSWLTWAAVDRGVEHLVAHIQEQGLKFDRIIGVARGGLIPAVILSHRLGVSRLETVRVHAFDTEGHRLPEPCFGPSRPLDFPNTLVVDDIFDSGATHRLLLRTYPSASHVALVSRCSDFQAPMSVPDGHWVVFPWECG